MIPVILAVHIDNGKWVDVPITPDTRCQDVIDCCREPSEEICTLVQTTGLIEQIVPEEACMMDLLSRWGDNWSSVTFHLQYRDPVDTFQDMGPRQHSPTTMKDYRSWQRKLPESNELSLADLRQMAARQQHQIEAHQQLLVAKEQRLKFLKQQEARHHQGPNTHAQEGDRLRYLREKVELQELKLRRLRALRGQVEQHKSNNSNLGAELESIRALFNEKEKELSMAVAKVEELTRQLEEVRRGDVTSLKHGTSPSPAALEFQKLKRELLYRSKLNEQQNARIAQQRETLARRQSEISQMDQRIAELQQRLQRKRLLNQQLSSQLHAASRTRPRPNIAAVEPLKRAAQDVELIKDDLKVPSDTEFTPNKKDPKYQTLPYNTKFPLAGNGDNNQKSHLVNGTDEKHSHQNGGPPPYPEPPSVHSPPNKPLPPRGLGALSPRPFISNSSGSTRGLPPRLATTNSSGTISSSNNVITSQPKPNSIGPPSTARSKTPVSFNNHQVILPPTVMTSGQPGIQRTIPQTPVRQHPAPSYSYARARSNENANKPAVPPKPGTPSKPVPPPRQIHGALNNLPKTDSVDQAISVLKGDIRTSDGQRVVTQVPPISNHHRLAPSVYNHHLHQKTTSDNSDSGTSLNGEIEARSSPQNRLPINGNNSSHSAETNNMHISLNRRIGLPPAFYFPENQTPPSDLNGSDSSLNSKRRPFTQDSNQHLILEVQTSENEMNSPKTPLQLNCSLDKTKDLEIKPPSPDSPSDHISLGSSSIQSSSLSPDSTDRSVSDIEQFSDRPSGGVAMRRKKGNLKSKGSVKNPRRVSFDPLALLLDAALEGELELVKKTAKEVPNPSAANDEGITALHNAICAGHLEIVKFLVEFGCDVNAQDSDGWTPLHCAASCNNLAMVKYLVERGACIFATTLSDHETAAEKCEEDEEGFDGCSEYLYSMQEKLGILNGGVVYALYDYESQNSDELSFRDGDQLVVLRKGDDLEREWWWSKHNDREGYVPRNLLGLHPRVTVKRDL
ncbi:apoptosis-stimulating of p53 protein 1 isoform X3 [Parasteatoda tepidariorum]|uniref:apoptosis-stimulating of p53 protein 1 isoform X3 n=1 Tax=Parasteatoda tepidariorum TaxID=114398 RepID=UPI00077F97B7|nr:apoptosis-stimulating of p53 protein 1 isoform X3 [Parasteatoda tepidariorum]